MSIILSRSRPKGTTRPEVARRWRKENADYVRNYQTTWRQNHSGYHREWVKKVEQGKEAMNCIMSFEMFEKYIDLHLRQMN